MIANELKYVNDKNLGLKFVTLNCNAKINEQIMTSFNANLTKIGWECKLKQKDVDNDYRGIKTYQISRELSYVE